MKVKISRMFPEAILPRYATAGSACFDLFCIREAVLESGSCLIFDTGLKFEIPEGFVMLVFSRSGHGFKKDIRLSNCVGVIDSDYRGELKVKLRADDQGCLFAKPGEAIAQAGIFPVNQVTFDEVSEDHLSTTERGEGGLGSTDRKFFGQQKSV